MSYELMKVETVRQMSGSEAFMEAVQIIGQYEVNLRDFRIVDDTTAQIANDALITIKKAKKNLDDLKKTGQAPYKKMMEAIKAVVSPLIEACDRMKEKLDGEILAFKKGEEERIVEAQKKAMAAEIEARGVGPEGFTVAPPKPLFYPGIQSEAGKSFTRKRLKGEVVDKARFFKAAMNAKAKLPMDCIQTNEAKLRECVNARLYTPKQWAKFGVRVWEEEEVVTRSE